jgi:hypothetical protein
MSDELELNMCGYCMGDIHAALTRDGRKVWVHEDRQNLTDWLAAGGNVHAPEPANLAAPDLSEEIIQRDWCNCPHFSDTKGFRIADLTCQMHGFGGTHLGDGPWDEASEWASMRFRAGDNLEFQHTINYAEDAERGNKILRAELTSLRARPQEPGLSKEWLEEIRWAVYRSLDTTTIMQNGEQQAALRGMKLFQDAILSAPSGPLSDPEQQEN